MVHALTPDEKDMDQELRILARDKLTFKLYFPHINFWDKTIDDVAEATGLETGSREPYYTCVQWAMGQVLSAVHVLLSLHAHGLINQLINSFYTELVSAMAIPFLVAS